MTKYKVVKDIRYSGIWDVYKRRWYGWAYVYWVNARDADAAEAAVKARYGENSQRIFTV